MSICQTSGWLDMLVAGGLGAQWQWPPVQGPSTPTGSPWGSDLPDQGQASDRNVFYSLYIPLALLSGTICSFVSMWPNHILVSNVEICYKDYFLSRLMYSYPSTINLMYYYTKVLLFRNYFYNHKSEILWKKVWPNANLVGSLILGGVWPKVSLTWSLTICQSDPKPHPGEVHLTKCQPDLKSYHTWPQDVSAWKVCLTQIQPNQKSDQMSTWPKASSWGVHLTSGQPDPKSDQMSTWPKASSWGDMSDEMLTWSEVISHLDTRCLCLGEIWPKVSLTRSLTKCQPDPKPDPGGDIWPKSTWPKDLTKMSTWPEASSAGGAHLTKCRNVIWKFEHTLHFRSCFTEVFSTKDQHDTKYQVMQLYSWWIIGVKTLLM